MPSRAAPLFRSMRLVGLVVFCLACGSDDRAGSDPAPAPPPEAEAIEAEPTYPGFPLFDDTVLLRAPERFDHLVPRLTRPTSTRFRNLRYEANNVGMRGPRGEDGFYESTGQAIAERWRIGAAGVKGVFATRDSLFSQQDHPIDHDPVSVMMPPVWLSVAIAETIEARPLREVMAPPIDDDDAWTAITTPERLFGSFPPSERLHETATRRRTVLAPERLRVTNARRSVHMLAADARAMVRAAAVGVDELARVGAERVVMSDRRYFGERLLREHVILVAVENPNTHELRDEMKGLTLHGRDIPLEAVNLARGAIFGARLNVGDIAFERYHLGRPDERRRAIRLLEQLIPPGGTGGNVWLWVHGGMDASGVRGNDASEYIHSFRAEVGNANLDVSRVRYLSKPHVAIGGSGMSGKLDQAARRFRQLDLPLNLAIGTGLVDHLIREIEN